MTTMEMTKAAAPNGNGPIKPMQRISALNIMAERLQVDQDKLFKTLKATVFKGASDDELLALVVVSNAYALNPLTKEIYAFPGKGGGIVPVVSIDGWISIVNRQDNYRGLSFRYVDDAQGKPSCCICSIYIAGRDHPIEIPEFFSECFRNTEPWKMMPRRMLRHKALIQCARVAFGFSGIYDQDEAEDIVVNSGQENGRRRIHVSSEEVDLSLPETTTQVSQAAATEVIDDPRQTQEETAPAPANEDTGAPAPVKSLKGHSGLILSPADIQEAAEGLAASFDTAEAAQDWIAGRAVAHPTIVRPILTGAKMPNVREVTDLNKLRGLAQHVQVALLNAGKS